MKSAVAGRVVTMDPARAVYRRGVVYLDGGRIAAVRDRADTPPVGFEDTTVVDTKGTIYPGLIELHNHLAYNALRLWQVPQRYGNRDQWAGTPTYRQLISGPMQVLGKTPDLLPAVVRYVECKCLMAGVTTTQGLELYSNHGGRRFYRGVVRNVEQTDEPALPEARTKIADVEATNAVKFLARLRHGSCFLLHLSEGRDTKAREHFLALRLSGDSWAIADSLAGIHCVALTRQDFAVMAARGASMVWSPLSNLLLYGETADVRAAKAAGVSIGLGSDWSPSGSKNLLGELKVAAAVSDAQGGIFSDSELLALATCDAAAILGWQNVLGALSKDYRSDLIAIDTADGDPYRALLTAGERDLVLVVIGGVARYGTRRLVSALTTGAIEGVTVGGRQRVLNLTQPAGDPVVGGISLAQARNRLRLALGDLARLAAKLEAPVRRSATGDLDGVGPPQWTLALDEIQDSGMELRPRLPGTGRGRSGPEVRAARAVSQPLSKLLIPLELDPITVADDGEFLDALDAQANLPAYLPRALRELYA